MNEPRIAVLTASWRSAPLGETATAIRSIAGALSQLAAVDVFVPGTGPQAADGAFDPVPIGAGADATWPAAADATTAARYRAVVVEAGDTGALGLAASMAPDVPVLCVGRAGRAGQTAQASHAAGATDAGMSATARAATARAGAVLAVDLLPDEGDTSTGPSVHRIGLYARVHPGASARRHYGLRAISDYLLVLGDRTGAPLDPWPSRRARWLLARFPRRYLVVVEGGTARIWRSRSCVGEFGVHTRMDLWILMAQATGVVDLLPGEVFARECVESLRYGVPVAVPDGSAADGLANGGGGLRFTSTAELLSCADALFDPATRDPLAARGREVADRWYGDPDALLRRLDGVLGALGVLEGRDGREDRLTGHA